jgi:CheY-like chemotaxis protein
MNSPYRILVIDDDEKGLSLLKLNLEYFGFEVITANGGANGLKKASEEIPDEIILDIKMPDINGWEVCKKLKGNSNTKDIPIVLVTAFSGPKDLEKSKNLKVESYLTKPVDPEKLADTLRLNLIKNKVENHSEDMHQDVKVSSQSKDTDSVCRIEHFTPYKGIDSELNVFSDYSISQSPSLAAVESGEGKFECVALKNAHKIYSFAIIKKTIVPYFNIKMASIWCGPIWKHKNEPIDFTIFEKMIDGLVNMYLKNGYILKITPFIYDSDPAAAQVGNVLTSFGFSHSEQRQSTLLLDLKQSAEELRTGLRKTWRQTLGYAEKKGITVTSDNTTESLQRVVKIYYEMQQRKKFATFIDMTKYGKINDLLEDSMRFQTISGSYEDKVICGIVWAKFGTVGLPIIAATTEKALKLKVANLIWWKMITAMKAENLEWCDLGGINKERNEGGYVFKTGIGGTEAKLIGQFHLAENKGLLRCIKAAENIKKARNRIKILFEPKKKILEPA